MNSAIYLNQIFIGIAALTSGLYLFYRLVSGKSIIASSSSFCVPTITNIQLLARESSIPIKKTGVVITYSIAFMRILLLTHCKSKNITLSKLEYYAQGGLPRKYDFILERYFTPCFFIGILYFALWSINLHYNGMRSLQWSTAYNSLTTNIERSNPFTVT